MPRSKKKTDYDADQVMKDFVDAVTEAFGSYDDRTDSRDPGLNAVAAQFGKLSANAERIRLYRERKNKCAKFSAELSALSAQEQETALWNMLIHLQGCVFLTAKGLKFTYQIRGGEMFVNRKSKSVTQATVFMAFRKAMELEGIVAGPKKLGTFGASYLYPIFERLGVIKK